ncbi:MAG: type II toxin-antitoxin system VapC family toxin [Nitrospira sp.]|uniref:PINc domain-containing protein n=1 Tax=Nitrospira defluvii TaxID=330214 RepID=A0ABN7LWG6_9BACT|nr:type II toxin-antitoxin system VapC family toxin [Nitrospira sp.]CAE6768116.1 PINc domain-containing protein [Nitrospira defluvii]
MTRVVVDASVVVKWLLPQREDEADVEQALRLIEGLRSGRVRVFQPVHWLAETAAVLVRLSPETAAADVADLYTMDLPIENGPNVYLTACELARSLNHHVFDTLYHAVALTLPDTVLITADVRYERAARQRGSIMLLSDLSFL